MPITLYIYIYKKKVNPRKLIPIQGNVLNKIIKMNNKIGKMWHKTLHKQKVKCVAM